VARGSPSNHRGKRLAGTPRNVMLEQPPSITAAQAANKVHRFTARGEGVMAI
jgi:hypothetical protein